MATQTASHCCKNYFNIIDALMDEYDDDNSMLWKQLIRKINKKQAEMASKCPIEILMSSDKENVKLNIDKISAFVDSMRYGDFNSWRKVSEMKDRRLKDSQFIRRWLLGHVQFHIGVLQGTVINEFSIFRDRDADNLPHLGTIYLIESLENPHLKCADVQYSAQRIFLYLFCLLDLYGDKCFRDTKACLGALLIFRTKEVERYLMDSSMDSKMVEVKHFMKIIIKWHDPYLQCRPKPRDAHSLCLKIKDWQQFGLKKMGYKIINQLLQAILSGSDADMMDSTQSKFSLFIVGKILLNGGQYVQCLPYLIGNIRLSSSIYAISLSLRYLSAASDKMSQYVIALRLLNVAHKLCTMYELTITPSFVNKMYPKKKKRIKKKLKKMKCSYCGRKGKLMCCTACMTAVYCSKLCQKRHWKEDHRNNCDRKWLTLLLYDQLKRQRVFERF